MSYLYEALIKKQSELLSITKQISESMPEAPKGKLRISHCGGQAQYYLREVSNDRRGKFLKKHEMKIACDIAQREYDKRVLEQAYKELKEVNQLLKKYQSDEMRKIYDKMSSCRKDIVMPHFITDKEFVEQWINVKYVHKPFSEGFMEMYTDKGERVRSKSEKIIADMLNREGIPYRYEYPITLKGKKVIHPDFTILSIKKRRECYLEHLGMMDNQEYCEKALMRLDLYTKNNIMLGERLFITYETSRHPMDTEVVRKIIQRALL